MFIGKSKLDFNSSPVVNNDSLNETICDNNADGVENYNWAEKIKE